MIRVQNPIPEPEDFRVQCRHQGEYWVSENPLAKPQKFPSYWTPFEGYLAEGFHYRCGWWAMYIADGQVDHFLSKDNYPGLAYEWSNYRYISGTVNSSKKKLDDRILDPYDVQDGWFEVILPSMQLIATASLPVPLRQKAALTLEKLHLVDGVKVVRVRRGWYEKYKDQKINLMGLEDVAPLIASAVKKLEGQGLPLP